MKRRAFLAGTGSVSLSLSLSSLVGCGGEKVEADRLPPPSGDQATANVPSASDVAFGGDGSARVFTNDGRSFSLTTERHALEVFSRDGAHVKTVGGASRRAPTTALGDLNGPVAAYWDETRNRLFVLERGNERIQVFDAEGNALGIHAKTSPSLDLNSDAMTDEMYVAASSSHMIEVYSKTTGRSLGVVGRFGTDEAGLNGPTSVARSSSDGNLHIVDAGSHRIKVLTRDGRFVHSYGADVLIQPRSIRFDNQGRAWVSDTFGASLLVFDNEGTRLLARFSPNLPTTGKRAAPTSLSRRPDGTIYAALIAAA